MAKGRGISRDIISNYRATLNVGYIVIPHLAKGENRKDFIENCYRRERVSIMLENGGLVQNDCYIMKHALRDVVFPETSVSDVRSDKSKLGSLVVVLNEPYHDQAFILGIVSKLDETNLFSELEYRVVKGKNGNYAVLSIDGKTGSININTYGVDSGGDLSINVGNQSGSATLSLGVKGAMSINVSGKADIYVKGDVNLSTEGNVGVKASRIDLGNSNLEAILKGDTTIEQLSKDLNMMKELKAALTKWVPTYESSLKAELAKFLAMEPADYTNIKSSKTFSE